MVPQMTEPVNPDAHLRILHVTEAMAAGTLTFLLSISRRQAEAGATVSILYAEREENPSVDELHRRFGPKVALRPAITGASSLRGKFALFRAVRELAGSRDFDVIHFHSSMAGGLGRLAISSKRGLLVAYSPHGFAFLREDKPRAIRSAFEWAERLLARRSILVLTSPSEVRLAVNRLRVAAPRLLKSGVSSESIPPFRTQQLSKGKPRVTMVGRMVFQKGPWRFASVAIALHDIAEFVWVGGGDAEDRERWIGQAPVRVIEWASPEELERLLNETDIMLFPTLWEGMALSLIQAQARGIPAVTTDIGGNRDTVIDGETGFVRATDEGLISATRTLASDPQLRRSFSDAALAHARSGLVDDQIGTDSIGIYREELARIAATSPTKSRGREE